MQLLPRRIRTAHSLTFTLSAPPAHGTATATAAGAPENHNGAMHLSCPSRGRGGKNAATLNVTITPVNDTPVITNASVTFIEDTDSTQPVKITDIEGDAVVFSDVTQPAHAALFNPNADGGIHYLAERNFHGTDTLTARVTDSHGAVSADTVITILVTPVNDTPVANDDDPVAATASRR
jgi:hypothetical protein